MTVIGAKGQRNMREEVVHIALKGDVVAMCDAPIDRSAPRAEEPEQATCQECIDTYIEGWAAAQQGRPAGTPSMPTYPPTAGRRPPWLLAVAGASLALAAGGVAYAFAGGGDGSMPVSGTVVDCSQTELWQSNDGGAMRPARIAQIRFDNDAGEREMFSPQVDGVTLVKNDGSPAKYTLEPHGSTVITYPMNPEKYGATEGSCYALNVTAVP
ncbi:hypothetical protein [Streptomyces sp. NBC_01171]|uniref:hypothetical protein n=1 Tax=Streptomyces sp. NBC_01171 TaxID=2903757 RepID=UPI00386AE8BF|nr:hypothetical protein OG448_30420 [Streptomyces sp. NBC_01171]